MTSTYSHRLKDGSGANTSDPAIYCTLAGGDVKGGYEHIGGEWNGLVAPCTESDLAL